MKRVVFAAAQSRALLRTSLSRSASDFAAGSKKNSVASATSSEPQAAAAKDESVNRAMKGYMRKVEAYNTMIAEHTAKFELGKRHIANIMGLDPNTITQQDIDVSPF